MNTDADKIVASAAASVLLATLQLKYCCWCNFVNMLVGDGVLWPERELPSFDCHWRVCLVCMGISRAAIHTVDGIYVGFNRH